jgi:hypothetical protein
MNSEKIKLILAELLQILQKLILTGLAICLFFLIFFWVGNLIMFLFPNLEYTFHFFLTMIIFIPTIIFTNWVSIACKEKLKKEHPETYKWIKKIAGYY